MLAEVVTFGVILCHWTAKGNSYHEMEYLKAETDLRVPSASPSLGGVGGGGEV